MLLNLNWFWFARPRSRLVSRAPLLTKQHWSGTVQTGCRWNSRFSSRLASFVRRVGTKLMGPLELHVQRASGKFSS